MTAYTTDSSTRQVDDLVRALGCESVLSMPPSRRTSPQASPSSAYLHVRWAVAVEIRGAVCG